MPAGDGGVAAHLNLRGPAEVHHAHLRVLGDVYQHGAGASSCGKVEGGGDTPRDFLRVRDHEGVLGDRHGHAHNVCFLEGVGAEQLRGHLPGDSDDGHRVHVCVRDGGEQVGGTGPAGCNTHTYFAGGGRIPLSGVPCTLLVAHQDVVNLGGIHERVIGGQDCPAGQTKNVGDAKHFKGADDRLGAGHALGGVCFARRRSFGGGLSRVSRGHINASYRFFSSL